MKYSLPIVLVLFLAGVSFAITKDEVVKLSKLKTSDELIVEVIQKEGLDNPISSKDVVYLKEQGVSDRVIRYMMKVSESARPTTPSPNGKSEMVGENLRAYTYTTKDGRKIRMVTNLDQNGKRMGGELPPPVEQEQAKQEAYQPASPEVRIVIDTPHARDMGPEYTPEEWEKYGLADYYWRYQPMPEVPEYGYTPFQSYDSYYPYAPYYGPTPYSYYGKRHGYNNYGYVDQSLQGKQNQFLSGPNYPPVDSGKVNRQRPPAPTPRRSSHRARSSSAGTAGKKPH